MKETPGFSAGIKLVLALIGVALGSPFALAVPEAQVVYEVHSTLLPFWSQGTPGQFIGAGKLPVRYHQFVNDPKALALVIVPGRSQPAVEYAEVIYDLRNEGFSVFALDLRGQGESGRMVSDPEVQFVRRYEDYVSDLHSFIQNVVKKTTTGKIVILGHSLGGAVAAATLAKYPGDADGALLVTPMFHILTGSYSEPVARSLAYGGTAFGLGKHYAPAQKGWSLDDYLPPHCHGTSSAARCEMEGIYPSENPRLRTGGVSYQWVREAFRITDKIKGLKAGSFLPKTLLLTAGNDLTVNPDRNSDFCLKTSLSCREVRYEEGRHSLMNEADSIRDRVMTETVSFLKAF